MLTDYVWNNGQTNYAAKRKILFFSLFDQYHMQTTTFI
jgi:hypothetical protein